MHGPCTWKFRCRRVWLSREIDTQDVIFALDNIPCSMGHGSFLPFLCSGLLQPRALVGLATAVSAKQPVPAYDPLPMLRLIVLGLLVEIPQSVHYVVEADCGGPSRR